MVFGREYPCGFRMVGHPVAAIHRVLVNAHTVLSVHHASMFTYCSQRAFKGCWLDGDAATSDGGMISL